MSLIQKQNCVVSVYFKLIYFMPNTAKDAKQCVQNRPLSFSKKIYLGIYESGKDFLKL